MEIVLGISIAPSAARLVLVEGRNADGVTVEQDEFAVAVKKASAAAAADRLVDAIVGTREGAAAAGYRLTSTGVTWTDPAAVGALRRALASRDLDDVMLVSPLLAAAALTQSVGNALGYERIAMLLVERDSATLAVVEVGDGSIVDQQRHALVRSSQKGVAAELCAMVTGVEACAPRADGLFVVGCDFDRSVDVLAIKAALEGATALEVIVPEEPDMALARGAALASANAPLFAASTAALAYSLDPGAAEMNPRALAPAYLDVSGNAELGAAALAYTALEDDDESVRPRVPALLVGSALTGVTAVAAAVAVVALTSVAHPSPPAQPTRQAAAPTHLVPPPEVQAPAPSLQPAAAPTPEPAAGPAPTPEAAPPPAPVPEAAALPAPTPVAAAPPAPPPVAAVPLVPPAPPAPRRVPARRAPEYAPAPVRPAPAPPAAPAPPPAAPPPPERVAAPAAPPPEEYRPSPRFYIRLPFVPVLIPIGPPPPRAPAPLAPPPPGPPPPGP
jgi:hypothetical protein